MSFIAQKMKKQEKANEKIEIGEKRKTKSNWKEKNDLKQITL